MTPRVILTGTRHAMYGALSLMASALLAARSGGQDLPAPAWTDAGDDDRATALDAELARLNAIVDEATAKKNQALGALPALKEQEAAAKQRLVARTHALYRLRRAGMLPFAGGFDSLAKHTARLVRLERMVLADAKSIRSLRAQRHALAQQLTRATEQVGEGRARIAALEVERTDALRALPLAPLAEGPAFTSATGGGPYVDLHERSEVYTPSGIFRVHDDPEPAASFAAEKGRLAIPVAGQAQVLEERGDHGPYARITGHPGSRVRAAAEGEVVFAGARQGQGQVVIVRHGERWFTVYAGLSNVEVQAGDAVSRGAGIGRSQDGQVRFEVRQGTRAESPSAWLGM